MRFAREPQVVVNPTGRAPLSAVVQFATDTPSRSRLVVENGGESEEIPTDEGFAPEHEIAVLGLTPNSRRTLRLYVEDENGDRDERVLEVAGDALPDELPPIDVRQCDPAQRAPGLAVFGIRRGAGADPAQRFGAVVAVDRSGDIVWCYQSDRTVQDLRPTTRGTVLIGGANTIVEVDMLGHQVGQWHAAGAYPDGLPESVSVETPVLHHSFNELPNGNFLAMSIDQRVFDNYPTSEDDPAAPRASANVVGDVLLEFTRNGDIVKHWNMFDILDPYRIGYNSLGGYWRIRGFADTYDWSHCNGVVYDPRDDSMVLSFRCQDAVVKVMRETGEIAWILGPHENWRAPWSDKLLSPAGPFEWQYHQHDPSITPSGTVMLFDNGTHRASAFEAKQPAPDNYSRVLEVEIDEPGRTVREVWSYGGPGVDAPYATYVSGAKAMPGTGNVLINYSGTILDTEGRPNDNNRAFHNAIHVFEVTRERERVFHLAVDTFGTGDKIGWGGFRIEHMPSLYAGKAL